MSSSAATNPTSVTGTKTNEIQNTVKDLKGNVKANETSKSNIALIALGAVATLGVIFAEINLGILSTGLQIAMANPLMVGFALTFATGAAAAYYITRPARPTQDPLGVATENFLTAEKNLQAALKAFAPIDTKYQAITKRLQDGWKIQQFMQGDYWNSWKVDDDFKKIESEKKTFCKEDVELVDEIKKVHRELFTKVSGNKDQHLASQDRLRPMYESLKGKVETAEKARDEAYTQLQTAQNSLPVVNATSTTGTDQATDASKPKYINYKIIAAVALSSIAVLALVYGELQYGIVSAALATIIANPVALFTLVFAVGAASAYLMIRLTRAPADKLDIATRNLQSEQKKLDHATKIHEQAASKLKSTNEALASHQSEHTIAQKSYNVATAKNSQGTTPLATKLDEAKRETSAAEKAANQAKAECDTAKKQLDQAESAYQTAYSALQTLIEAAKSKPPATANAATTMTEVKKS